MNWIFDNFQILALVGIAFASWLKHRMDAKVAEREERQERNEPEGYEEVFGPEETWPNPYGQPAPSVPPPLYPQAPPPLPRVEPLPHSREGEAAAQLKRQQEMQERLRQIKEAKTTTTGGAAATRARVALSKGTALPFAPSTHSAKSIKATVRNPKELRRAIILREILGAPVTMR